MIVLKDQNDTQLITQQGNYIRQELYDELEKKLEEQTKTYQKILQEQQEEIDNLQRNCDVFTEQMNDAVERTVELNKEKQELKEWLEEEIKELENFLDDDFVEQPNIEPNEQAKFVMYKMFLERLGE